MINIAAKWSALKNITAFTTTRANGFSSYPFAENNLGLHVGDNFDDVMANRYQLLQKFHMPNEPQWLEQVHGNRCVDND